MSTPIRELAWIVARDVNRTVGGGTAAIELLRRSLGARGWVDASTHGLLVAVSRLTPGTNILAYCAAAGWRLRGWRGTLTAVAAASLPASLLIYAVAATLVRLDRYAAVRVALSIGMLVAAVLVLASAWALLEPYLRQTRRGRALLIAAIAIALYLAGWTPVRILLASAIVGALLPAVVSTSRPAAPAAAGPQGASTASGSAPSPPGPSDPPSPRAEAM